MSQETAAFEGLQYSSQFKPYDFGQIAVGIAEISEKKRLEAERKAKELDDKQMQLIKDYGEEIYSTFDKTGLENFDQLGLDIKNLVLERAESVTSRLNNGEITGAQAAKEMMMMKNQSAKVSSYYTGLKEYADQIRAKGENASPSDLLKLERLDNMISNGVSVAMDSNSNFMFLSEENGKLVPSPFSKLSGYQTFSNNLKADPLIDEVMKSSGLNKFIKDGQEVTSVLTKDGTLRDGQVKAFSDYVSTLSAEDVYDLGTNLGIDIKYKLDGKLSIEDADNVNNKIVEKLKERAVSKYSIRETKDEMPVKKLSLQLNQDYRAAQRFKEEMKGAEINIVGEEDGPQEVQVLAPANKKVSVNSLIVEGKSLPFANVGKYIVDSQGNHRATISYKQTIDVPNTVGQGTTAKEVTITEDVVLTDPATINQIRAQFKMPSIKEMSQPSTTKKEKAY